MNDTMNRNSHELPVLSFMTESGSEDVHYPLMYEGLPEEFKFLAEEELNESEEKKLNGIQMLRDHIQRKKLHDIPDYLLVATLRVSKYDIKKSKSKIEKFITLRKEIADLLAKTGLKKMELVLDNFSCGLLPYRDKSGSFVIYTRPDAFDLNRHTVDDAIVVGLLLVLLTLQFPITTVCGVRYLPDCKHPSITYVYPSLKAAIRFMLHPLSLPIRIAKVNILNPLSATYFFYRMLSAVFPLKLTKRISILPKGYEALQKELNKKILPQEFSGDAGPLSNSHYKANALEFARKLIAEYE